MSDFDWSFSDINTDWNPADYQGAVDYSQFSPTDYSDYVPQVDPSSFNYGGDSYGFSGDPTGETWNSGPRADIYGDGTGMEAGNVQAMSPLDRLNAMIQDGQSFLGSPVGKIAQGGLGALVGLYGQKRSQKDLNKWYQKSKALQDARRAEAMKYNDPKTAISSRRVAEAPSQRRGESVFIENNQLPHFATGGGSFLNNLVAERFAEGGPVDEDKPSVLGFIKYAINRGKLPSEVRQEAEAQALRTGVPNKYMTRQMMLERQMAEAEGRPVEQETIQRARGGYVAGGTTGQADKIPAMLSDGEYVMDADVVSALGDGNNAAGAKALDQMRQNVRAHKRGASPKSIPPPAKSPLAYLKGKGAK